MSLWPQENFTKRSVQQHFTWPLESAYNADLEVSKDVWCTDKSPATGAKQQDYAINRHKHIEKSCNETHT